MTAIDELIAVADRLCQSLDKASENEKKFSINICLELERYSWDIYRMMNDLQVIKEEYGG